MTVGTFTVGRDAQAVFIAPNGARLDFSGLTEFKWTPKYKTVSVAPLNSPPIVRELPDGHSLSFTLDRNGNANDRLVSQIEQGWWSVGSVDQGTSANGSIFVYINEADNSQTTYQFSGASLKMTSGGDFKTDTAIKQSFEAHAQRFQVV